MVSSRSSFLGIRVLEMLLFDLVRLYFLQLLMRSCVSCSLDQSRGTGFNQITRIHNTNLLLTQSATVRFGTFR